MQQAKLLIRQETVRHGGRRSDGGAEERLIAYNEPTEEQPSDISTTVESDMPLLREDEEDDLEMGRMIVEIEKLIEVDENTKEKIIRKPLKKQNDNFKLTEQIRIGNKAIGKIVAKQPDTYRNITALNKLIYATAETIQNKLIPPVKTPKKKKKPWTDEPPWKKRIQSQIAELRRELSQLK